MAALNVYRSKHRDWDSLALQVEVRTLQRELAHLSEKKRTRRLSYWEEQRLIQIPQDISRILHANLTHAREEETL